MILAKQMEGEVIAFMDTVKGQTTRSKFTNGVEDSRSYKGKS